MKISICLEDISLYTLEGDLPKLQETINKWNEEYIKTGDNSSKHKIYDSLELKVAYDYDDRIFQLHGIREEAEQEKVKREDKEKQIQEANKSYKHKQYEQLKKELGID